MNIETAQTEKKQLQFMIMGQLFSSSDRMQFVLRGVRTKATIRHSI